MSGLASLGPSDSSPADTIENKSANCLVAIVQLLTKKNRSSELGGFFSSNLFYADFFFRIYLIVEMEGLEPSSKQATWILSTCLVFIWFSSGSRLKTIYFKLSFLNFERPPKLRFL